MSRWKQFKGWLVEPSPRFYLFILAVLIGAIASAGIIIGRDALKQNKQEAVARAEQDTLTKAEVHRLVNRLVKIESPSTQDFARRIERALNACLKSRECRRTFVLVSRRTGVTIVRTPSKTGNTPPDGRTLPQHSNPPQPRRPAPSKRPSNPGRPSPTNAPPPTQTTPSIQVPGNPPPGAPVPPSIITVPLPSLCTPIVDVNCPPPA